MINHELPIHPPNEHYQGMTRARSDHQHLIGLVALVPVDLGVVHVDIGK